MLMYFEHFWVSEGSVGDWVVVGKGRDSQGNRIRWVIAIFSKEFGGMAEHFVQKLNEEMRKRK